MNAWKVLGVPETATDEQIRAAHKREILRYHPDRAPAGMRGQFEEHAKHINAARDELLHRRRRSAAAPRPTSSPPRPSAATYTPAASGVPPHQSTAPRDWQTPTPQPPPAQKSSAVAEQSAGGRDIFESISLFVTWSVIIYFAVLAFAIIGWLLTALLPAMMAVLA